MTAPSRPPAPGVRRMALGALLAAGLLGACTRDAPLGPERTARPDRPHLLMNPLCAVSGGTTHSGATLTSAVNWWPSDNPHRVIGTQNISAGGSLRLRPGVLVCFSPVAGIEADGGGHLAVDGDDTARVVLTAADPAQGWYGVVLRGTPSATSFIGHARLEYVNVYLGAVVATDAHTVVLDSVTIRQSGHAAMLVSPQSRIMNSHVDTTTNPLFAAVVLGDSARFIRTTVRGAAGAGVRVHGHAGVQLLGGRIEGSAGTGLHVLYPGAVSSFQPIRVTGGGSYPAELPIDAVSRGYGTVAEMDSLAGNARDTLVLLGGILTGPAYVTAALPWRMAGGVQVATGGSLRPQPGSSLVFSDFAGLLFQGGGRLIARGTQAAPVLFTAQDPVLGWRGIQLVDTPSSISYLTNARVEHVSFTAVRTDASHAVVIDSTVFRQVGSAASLRSGSRISRTRVDTTLNAYGAAVELYGNAQLESTLVRGAAGDGVGAWASTVQVSVCEVRESAGDGIQMGVQAVQVHDCNLVDNGGYGVNNPSALIADVTDNWWGDATGPHGTNGDGVYNGDYTPWRTTPYVLPYVP